MKPTKRPYSVLRSTYRMLALIIWCISMPLFFFIAQLLGYKKIERIPMWFHRGVSRIFNIHLTVRGKVCDDRPVLFVSNHISYLDIFLLGSIVPGFFIAKSEVACWPLLGKLAKLQNTLFIERNSRRAKAQVSVLQNHLKSDANLILFPEGTSTDGAHVEPFKSSLFHAAELNDKTVFIQPITLAYTHHKGHRMDQQTRDYYAWYANMPFLSHFLKAAGMQSAQAELIIHPPVKLQDFESRKACADHCFQQVANALDVALQPTSEMMNEDQSVTSS